MPLEDNINESSNPDDLDPSWPLGGDPKSEGDDHIRNVKLVLRNVYRALLSLPTGLAEGSIPAHFGGSFGDSGLIIKEGTLQSSLGWGNVNFFLVDPFTGTPSLIPFTDFDSDGDMGTFALILEAEEATVRQPLEGETNVAAIAFPFTATRNAVIEIFRVKGDGLLAERVRLTMRADDINGTVIFQSATTEELVQGGGFTVNPTGVSAFALVLPVITEIGKTYFMTLDRYDTVTETIVDSGIDLLGATLGGFFIPYFETTAHPFEPKEMAFKEDVLDVIYLSDMTPVVVVGTATEVLHILTIPSATASGDFELLSSFGASANNTTSVSAAADINGSPLDLDGAGNLYQRAIDSGIVQENSIETPISHTTGTDTVITISLTGLVAARTITTAHDYIRVRRLSNA